MCFVKFCQLILESDDETGYCCELVQDFLKEQGGSKKVEEILNKKMQEIRGADVLIAGLCHPCPEMRSLVLSEMQQFRVPPRPFADGTILTLKNIAASSTCVVQTCCVILSIAQIAQMGYCSGRHRAETIQWMLKMLQSKPKVLADVHFALIRALGTLLMEREADVDQYHFHGIVLRSEDESVLLLSNLRNVAPIADALSDLKVFSDGLVDWLQSEPCRIAAGRWPMSHVRFICEKVVEFKDSARASRMAQSLLVWLHSLSFDEVEWKPLLKCLGTLHELLGISMSAHVLPFLKSGKLVQRGRVLQSCAKLKLGFEGKSLKALARCLLAVESATCADDSSAGSLLMYVLRRELGANLGQFSSLQKSSYVFSFLFNVAKPDSKPSRAMGPVFSELLDFERRLEEGKQEQKKKEEESNQKQSDGGEDFVFDFKTEKRPKIMSEESVLGKELASRERVNGEQKPDDSAIGEEEEEREGEEGEVKEYPSLHDLSSKVTAFTPSELDGFHGRSQLLRDKMTNFCAAKLWTSSGLTTLNGNQSLSALMMLSDSQSAQAQHLFASLQALTTPWIHNGGENRLDRVFREVMRLKTFGRFFFATLL